MNQKFSFSKPTNKLPEIDVANSFAAHFVTKAVSLTFIILICLILVSATLLYFIEIDLVVEAEGILEPSNIVQIHSPESGIIKEIFVSSGDFVVEGDMIALLDSTQLHNSLVKVESEIQSIKNKLNKLFIQKKFDSELNRNLHKKAQAQLIKAQASFRDRLTNYFSKPNIDSIYNNYVIGTNITVDHSMAEILIIESEIENKKIHIEMLDLTDYEITELNIMLNNLREEKKIIQNKLSNIFICSPITGTILTEDIENQKGSFYTEGKYLLSIGQKNIWNPILFVEERDVHQIKIENKVKIEMNALQTTENFELYDAKVLSIASEKINSSEKYSAFQGLYRVTAQLLPNQKQKLNFSKLEYGYRVKGKIITDSGKIIDLIKIYFNDLI